MVLRHHGSSSLTHLDFRLQHCDTAVAVLQHTRIIQQSLRDRGSKKFLPFKVGRVFCNRSACSITYWCRIQIILCIIKLTFQESFTRFTWKLVLTRKWNEYHIAHRSKYVLLVSFVAQTSTSFDVQLSLYHPYIILTVNDLINARGVY